MWERVETNQWYEIKIEDVLTDVLFNRRLSSLFSHPLLDQDVLLKFTRLDTPEVGSSTVLVCPLECCESTEPSQPLLTSAQP